MFDFDLQVESTCEPARRTWFRHLSSFMPGLEAPGVGSAFILCIGALVFLISVVARDSTHPCLGGHVGEQNYIVGGSSCLCF